MSKTTSITIGATTVKTVRTDFAQSNEPSVNDVDEVEINLEVTACARTMTVSSGSNSRLVALILAGTVVLLSIEGAVSVTLATLTYDTLRLSEAASPGLDGVLVETWSLNRSGGDVVGVTTAINNTKTTDLSVDVTVRLEQLDGSVVESETTTVLLGSVTVTTVELSPSQPQPQPPSAFGGVDVTVSPSYNARRSIHLPFPSARTVAAGDGPSGRYLADVK